MGDGRALPAESRSFRRGAFCGIWEEQRSVKRKIQLAKDEREEVAEGPQCLDPCHDAHLELHSEIREKSFGSLDRGIMGLFKGSIAGFDESRSLWQVWEIGGLTQD